MIRLLLAWLFVAGPAAAVTCENVNYLGNRYTACTVDVANENLQLFHSAPNGKPFGSFAAIEAFLDVRKLTFAMNAGMYHDDRRPVGLYVQNTRQIARLVTRKGPGNFGLLPNGVFCIQDRRADVIETLEFQAKGVPCRHASQSGPMLVIDGDLHPRFLPDGTSRNIRNGVGTNANGSTAVFVISNNRVNFHDFAVFFRDHLELDQALYFDGKVSRLHAAELKRSDLGFPMGPIVGVID